MSLNDAKRATGDVTWGALGWGTYQTTMLPSVSSVISSGSPAWQRVDTTPRLSQSRSTSPSPRPLAHSRSASSRTLDTPRAAFGELGPTDSPRTAWRSARPGFGLTHSASAAGLQPLHVRGLAHSSSARGLAHSPSADSRPGTSHLWFHTADGPAPGIVHSVASATTGGSRLGTPTVTRRDSSLLRGTASSMMREGGSSPGFRRHWMIDRPATSGGSPSPRPRAPSPIGPSPRAPFGSPMRQVSRRSSGVQPRPVVVVVSPQSMGL